MMGGGFGGCTINLVAVEAVESITQKMQKDFLAAFDREPGIYPVNLAQGAGPLERV
jgi:galactokinase